jgi:sulfatase maturation enzyme AslB (radical SAM superfamily)
MRKRFNQLFLESFETALTTKSDGHVDNLKMKYFDVRFSNICNFKCRGCSPTLSTKWYEDHQKLWDYKSEAPKLINFTKNTPPLWKEIEGYLPHVEIAYFAGGEPLLMDEHYECLEKFIELKKTDVILQYNTNLSILKFKKYDILDLWSQFENVNISVSLDDIEERGEYFRSGLNWDTFLKNCLIIKERFPHFIFTVNCTISVFNIHRVPEIHHELFSRGIITPFGFNFNTLLDPIHYRTQIATSELKLKTSLKLKSYIGKLNLAHPNSDWSHFTAALNNQIHFMNSGDLSSKLNEFKKVTQNLDRIRSESFSSTYPELKELLN